MHANYKRRWRWAYLLLALAFPTALTAQVVACDFDIDDNLGNFVSGNTIHLTGRVGAGTNVGTFVLINGDRPELDVDHDGYAPAPGCDYNDLIVDVPLSANLVNTENPALAIPFANVIVTNLPHSLPSGARATVSVSVDVPAGTAAGRYIGRIVIDDRTRGVTLNATGETLGRDAIFVEVTVAESRGLGIVNADTARTLDSLIVAGRAGQRAQGVLRVANLGNAALPDVRVTTSDLRSESAVGMVIPAQNVVVSGGAFPSLGLNDTARVTVTVNVPRGILGGRYRGTLFVQGSGAAGAQIPLIAIVSSSRGIVFENNPVRAATGGIARIAFNGDPGTQYSVAVFDMSGLTVFTTAGTVFAGVSSGAGVAPGGPAAIASPGADFAANVVWPLVNGRGEGIASGMYLVVVQSTVNGQRQLARDRLMVIR